MSGNRKKEVSLRVILLLVLIATTALGPMASSAAPNAWSKLNLDGVRVNTIAVDPTNASIIYAGTNGGGIFRSTNGGQSWAAINNGLGHLFVNDLIFDPRDPSVILAGTGLSPALGETNAGVYRTTNRGDSWSQQASAFVSALDIDPADPNVMFAAGAPAVLKSTNGGLNWAQSFAPGSSIANIDGTGVAVNPSPPSVVLLVGNTEGGVGQIFRSTDSGATWNLVLGGLPPLFDVAFGPPSRTGVASFVAADTGVFRSNDSGITFTRVSEELGDVTVFQVLVNPLASSSVFAATLGRGVFVSSDGGDNWVALDGTLGNQNVRGLDIDLISPQTLNQTLYAGTEDGVWEFTFAPSPPPQPSPQVSWFFAEGSSQPPFDTWFLLQNPTGQPATAVLNFLLQGGGTQTHAVSVPPTSRVSVFANQILPNQAFSTRIDADQRIFAERAMFVTYDGHSVTGLASPSRIWLFAEGSTQSPFHTWLLLENQNTVPSATTITYMLEDGQSVVQRLGTLPPLSRTSIFVNQVLSELAFSTRIESDLPIVAERAMYRFPGNAATGVVGVTGAASTWFFAEGRSSLRGMDADTFLLLQNPSSSAVNATIRLFRSDGTVQNFTRVLPPTSRTTIQLDLIFSGEFGISVEASGDIIAERSVFFGNEPKGAYATQGATQLGSIWNLPEGSTAAPFDEIVSVLNTTGSNMGIRAEFQLQSGQVIAREFTVGPTRKFDIVVDDIILNQAVSTRIIASSPTVVERTMLINKSSLGAHNTIGIRE